MIAIRLMPKQISELWPSIKHAATSVDRVDEKDLSSYLNNLLYALLNDKAQCFIRLSDERRLLALAITRLTVDEVTGDRSLFINTLYSFERVVEEQWKADIELIKELARSHKCRNIVTYSTNERVYQILEAIGFSERYRCFIMNLGA